MVILLTYVAKETSIKTYLKINIRISNWNTFFSKDYRLTKQVIALGLRILSTQSVGVNISKLSNSEKLAKMYQNFGKYSTTKMIFKEITNTN